jgi:hypothetical protein
VALRQAEAGDAYTMEPISAALAGIALVQKSVEFIKSNINTAKDIGEIAGAIDSLFTGEKQVQEARNKKSGTGLGDQFGVDTVAKEIIDAKLAQEKLQEVATMVDMRFGHGTWSGILAERQKRIQEQREAQAKARRKAQQDHDAMMDNLKIIAAVFVVIAMAVFLILFLMFSTAMAMSLML